MTSARLSPSLECLLLYVLLPLAAPVAALLVHGLASGTLPDALRPLALSALLAFTLALVPATRRAGRPPDPRPRP